MTRNQEKAFENGDKLKRTQAQAFKTWEKKGYRVAFTDSSGGLVIKRQRRDNRNRKRSTGRYDYKVIGQNGHCENFYQ